MAWEITIHIDADQEDVGTVSGTWTDPNAALGIFTFSKRVKANVAGANEFGIEAMAARDAWQLKQQANIDKAAWVQERINSADPKVGV